MDILSMIIGLFIVLEAANVMILYFSPDSKLGNGVAVFNHWEKTKTDVDLHDFIKYLVWWVAGTKLIFIVLLAVILATGSDSAKILSVVGLIFSISTFYWKLYPTIKKLDENGQITPKGYSKTLGKMIAGFLIMFSIALIIELVL